MLFCTLGWLFPQQFQIMYLYGVERQRYWTSCLPCGRSFQRGYYPLLRTEPFGKIIKPDQRRNLPHIEDGTPWAQNGVPYVQRCNVGPAETTTPMYNNNTYVAFEQFLSFCFHFNRFSSCRLCVLVQYIYTCGTERRVLQRNEGTPSLLASKSLLCT